VLAAVLVAIVAFVIVNRNLLTSAPGSAVPGAPGDRGLAVGAAAPLISLQSTSGTTISLGQLRGSKVVVYFYESSG
jgi:cytochrome oxidase Cu insertion factor (SCO1/SenC/PrrC family)